MSQLLATIVEHFIWTDTKAVSGACPRIHRVCDYLIPHLIGFNVSQCQFSEEPFDLFVYAIARTAATVICFGPVCSSQIIWKFPYEKQFNTIKNLGNLFICRMYCFLYELQGIDIRYECILTMEWSHLVLGKLHGDLSGRRKSYTGGCSFYAA